MPNHPRTPTGRFKGAEQTRISRPKPLDHLIAALAIFAVLIAWIYWDEPVTSFEALAWVICGLAFLQLSLDLVRWVRRRRG